MVKQNGVKQKGKPKMTKSNVVELPKREGGSGSAVAEFIREHPGAVVAGGLAVGLIAGAVLSRGSGRKLASQALALAEVAGTAGLALGRQAMERAEDTGNELRQQGEALAEKAGKLAEPAEEAVDAASEAAQRLLRKAVELAGKLRA
jgi:ElaB/YqjD/DUF883 family membrane-anchored ribosome-binding protein